MYTMDELTTVDSLLLNALDGDIWRTRAEVAGRLPQIEGEEARPLNQYEIKRLERLVRHGYVERSERPYTRARTVYVYRRVEGATP
jgi:hypothetical protein